MNSPPKSITTRTCVVVTCRDCGDHYSVEDGYTPHYDTIAEAKEQMEGWTWPDEQTAVCPNCQVRAACATEGHQWDGWTPCYCSGRIAGHEQTAYEVRRCNRTVGDDEYGFCPEHETRAAA